MTDSRDYWDGVLEQLGRRRLFKLALAALALLYASAIYAPLVANDRPYVLDAIDYGEYARAQRSLPRVTSNLSELVGTSEEKYRAGRMERSTQSREQALESELGAALGRIETMLAYLPAARAALLEEHRGLVESAVSLDRAGRREEARTNAAAAEELAVRIRSELGAREADDPAGGGIELRAARSYPLLATIGPAEVFFMVLWGFVLAWPLWNPAVNRLLFRGDRGRVRRRRRTKGAFVLAASLGCALLWQATGPAGAAAASIKAGLTSGAITAERAVFPPIAFGYREINSGEYFRPPTWKDDAEISAEGYYVRGARVPEADPVTGYLPPPSPVMVSTAEPGANDALRHPLGTDSLGRDLLARTLWGGRVSLSVGLLSAAVLVCIGTLVGALAGYFGGRVDLLLSRLIELLLCFPAFFLILLVIAFTDPDVVPPIIAIVVVIGLVRWTGVARLTRAEFLRLREQEFVVAARALGLSPLRTIFRHMLPNAMGPILVSGAFAVAAGILTESALSFLGFGVSEPIPSWGSLVNESHSAEHWWIILFPGLLIFLTVSCYNVVGEALRDAVDPRLRD